MPSARRLAQIILGLAVSAGLLVYCFWDVDLAVIAARLRETLWTFLALSVALAFGSLWARAWRWGYLFPPGPRPRRPPTGRPRRLRFERPLAGGRLRRRHRRLSLNRVQAQLERRRRDERKVGALPNQRHQPDGVDLRLRSEL